MAPAEFGETEGTITAKARRAQRLAKEARTRLLPLIVGSPIAKGYRESGVGWCAHDTNARLQRFRVGLFVNSNTEQGWFMTPF
jgi:hypothetical protein